MMERLLFVFTLTVSWIIAVGYCWSCNQNLMMLNSAVLFHGLILWHFLRRRLFTESPEVPKSTMFPLSQWFLNSLQHFTSHFSHSYCQVDTDGPLVGPVLFIWVMIAGWEVGCVSWDWKAHIQVYALKWISREVLAVCSFKLCRTFYEWIRMSFDYMAWIVGAASCFNAQLVLPPFAAV